MTDVIIWSVAKVFAILLVGIIGYKLLKIIGTIKDYKSLFDLENARKINNLIEYVVLATFFGIFMYSKLFMIFLAIFALGSIYLIFEILYGYKIIEYNEYNEGNKEKS